MSGAIRHSSPRSVCFPFITVPLCSAPHKKSDTNRQRRVYLWVFACLSDLLQVYSQARAGNKFSDIMARGEIEVLQHLLIARRFYSSLWLFISLSPRTHTHKVYSAGLIEGVIIEECCKSCCTGHCYKCLPAFDRFELFVY